MSNSETIDRKKSLEERKDSNNRKLVHIQPVPEKKSFFLFRLFTEKESAALRSLLRKYGNERLYDERWLKVANEQLTREILACDIVLSQRYT